MHEWLVVLTQRGGSGSRFSRIPYVRHHKARCFALDADDAARRAQKTFPGWTAVLVVRQP